MQQRLRQRTLVLLLLFCLLSGSILSQAAMNQQSSVLSDMVQNEILCLGIHKIENELNEDQGDERSLSRLEEWYNTHPLIDFASLIASSITIRFIDGSYTVMMNPFADTAHPLVHSPSPSVHEHYGTGVSGTALLLNTAESMYGHRFCTTIIAILMRHQYSIEYLANQAVDLSFIRNNLSADIIYMNTHAGYFDVDGDHQADAVVIATGEYWTNETEQDYAFDYQNRYIVKGMVGDTGFIAFTPAFIDYYYAPGTIPGSLVFMATCYATYDESMAQEFLDAGATVYVGWSQNTVFWTNSRTSVRTFRLLANGFTVHQVCALTGSGGFYNWLFHSKLIYYGDGDHRIPR